LATPPRAAPSHRPPSPGGEGVGITLSLLVHGLLLAALLLGLRWKDPPAQAVSAELWAAVPQAAPPVAAPPPPPAPAPTPAAPAPRPAVTERDADIALEQARKARQEQAEREKAQREKAERERAEREKADREKAQREMAERDRADREKAQREKADREKAEREKTERDARARADAERREKAAAEAREARQRDENLRRMMSQLGGASAPGTPGAAKGTPSAGGAGPSASYAGRIIAAVKPNIVFSDNLPGNPAAEVEVRAGPGGTIIGRTLVRSSGHREWDEAVLRAIDRTGTLPRDVDGTVPSRLTITFRPRD
jgi:colicin import membrane protein